MEQTKKELQNQLRILYKKWPIVRKFLVNFGCEKENGEDIFQEALIIFIRKQEDPSFILSVEPISYVQNICKLLWFNQSRKEGKKLTFVLEPEVTSIEDDWFEKELKLVTVEKAIQKLGKQCKQLLELFYGAGKKMEEIAKIIGLRNEKVAKAQKYRCIQKAKENAQEIELLNLQNESI